MSDFLKNLKDAVEKGEFNSDAANKINEIGELAEKKMDGFKEGGKDINETVNVIEEKIKKRVDDAGHKTISEEEAKQLNTEYERKMEEFKKIDLINKQLATLIEMEDMVLASIEDMVLYCGDLESRLEKDFDRENSNFTELFEKIESVKSKYNSFIN